MQHAYPLISHSCIPGPDLSSSSVILAQNYTAGSNASLALNLTDSLGNTITEGIPGLLVQAGLQLLLTPASGAAIAPQPISIPHTLGPVGSQGVTVAFQCNWTGRLAVSVVMGQQQLVSNITGANSFPWFPHAY